MRSLVRFQLAPQTQPGSVVQCLEHLLAAGFVTLIRRTFVALVVGMALAAAIRVRGRGGVPPQTGGWRELRDDELA